MLKRGSKKGTRVLTFYGNGNIVKSKRSQVSLFIILGIIIVVIGVLIFLFWPNIRTFIVSGSDPQSYVQSCISPLIEEKVKYISEHGGSLNLQQSVMYRGVNISYLCYINEFYKTCVMQKPMLKSSIESELENAIRDKLNSCFDDVVKDFEGKGFNTIITKNSFSVEILPQNIRVFVDYTITTEKDGNVNKFEKFNLDTKTSLFDLVSVAQSIANWEARYGDSETTLYMTYYPNIKVEKLLLDDGTKIYTVTDRTTKDKFTFATRSVAWPAGY